MNTNGNFGHQVLALILKKNQISKFDNKYFSLCKIISKNELYTDIHIKFDDFII